MSKRTLHVCLITPLLFSGILYAEGYKLGSHIENFVVQDLSGNPVSSAKLRGEVTVVIFIATQCPISNGYNERMIELYKDYSPKGVHFIFVNPNRTESADDVAKHAKAQSFEFAVYKDAGNVVADKFGAHVTPETFVIDKAGNLRYHGYIDDSLHAERIGNKGLRKALDAVLTGAIVGTPETKAFGCAIQRVKQTDALKPIDEAGYARTLAGYKGKIVLVHFWASWCHGCREEMPQLIKLQQRLGDGFVMITVSVDEPSDAPAAVEFLQEKHAPSPAYLKRTQNDEGFINSVDSKWDGSLPATFLYGRDGHRAASFFGTADINQIEAAVNRLR